MQCLVLDDNFNDFIKYAKKFNNLSYDNAQLKSLLL